MSIEGMIPNLHFTASGRGPDVLLIHGWASSSAMWNPLMEGLRQDFHCIAVDLIGFGDSPPPQPEQEADLTLHLQSLIAFCERRHLRPRAVIGHSMGGMLTLKFAQARPDLMDKLVLIAPVVRGRFGELVDLHKLVTSDVGDYALQRSEALWKLVQSDMVDVIAPLLSRPGMADDNSVLRILQDVKRSHWRAAVHGIRSIARENLGPHLPEIKHPALVIVGSRDLTVPPEEGKYAAEHLPNAELLELAGLSHQVLDESPRRVVDAVRGFLSNTDAGEAS
jgi:pimeloyl-ACP methyl ester carboxylesterase